MRMDPHSFEKLDLDPHSPKKLDPDPHSSKKLDPDPHKVNADPKHWSERLFIIIQLNGMYRY
jgi:hypothetical protein